MTRSDRRAEAALHLSTIRDQKISLAKYSEISGVPLHQLRYWRKRELMEVREGITATIPTFHSIPFSFVTSVAYTIHIGSNRLEISRGFVPGEVISLVTILKGA